MNYAARAAGITRHMRVHEAKKICPELELVHVETIGVQTHGVLAASTICGQHLAKLTHLLRDRIVTVGSCLGVSGCSLLHSMPAGQLLQAGN